MKKFIKFFANLELAIFLLLLIAFFSGLGSIIEQDKSFTFYIKNYSKTILGFPTWKYLKILDLDHIYTAWWFFSLLLVFGVCLLSCTFSQQFPALKFARRYYFYTYSSQFNKLKDTFVAEKPLKGQVCFRLLQEDYAVFQKQFCFYAYKGLIGRLGPVVVHLSIICILLGSIFGALKGFSAQEFIPKSEIFHVQNLVKSGYFSKVSQKAFRINDFWVNYNKTGLIKQFQSDISILSGQGDEIIRKTISVNNPLVSEGLTLYQTDWGISGLRLKLKNRESIIQLPVSKVVESSQKVWVSWLPLDMKEKTGILLVLNNARGKIDFYTQNAQFLTKESIGQTSLLTNLASINIVEFISSTGIQIKTDPGIQTIYLGFAFLILSSFISYVSFSEFWFLQTSNTALFGGQSNRAKIKFKLETLKLKKIFQQKKTSL
jgi:cytochrome c biogenesis protein